MGLTPHSSVQLLLEWRSRKTSVSTIDTSGTVNAAARRCAAGRPELLLAPAECRQTTMRLEIEYGRTTSLRCKVSEASRKHQSETYPRRIRAEQSKPSRMSTSARVEHEDAETADIRHDAVFKSHDDCRVTAHAKVRVCLDSIPHHLHTVVVR